METYHKFKIEQNLLRVYAVGSGVLLTIYCCMLCFGIRHFVAELTCLSGAYVLLLGGAWMYRLCWLSWAFILYTYAVRICIMLYGEGFWEGDGLFGFTLLHTAHIFVAIPGIILTSVFVFRIKHYLKIILGNEESKNSD